MAKLGDKFRELQSICEGEILKKEATIVALRRELARVKEELAVIKDPRLAARSPKCENCAYRVVALKILEEEKEKAE